MITPILFMALVGVKTQSDFDLDPSSLKPIQNELIAEEAFPKIKAYAVRFVGQRAMERHILCLEKSTKTKNVWKSTLAEQFELSIDSRSGRLVSFSNLNTNPSEGRLSTPDPFQSQLTTRELEAQLKALIDAVSQPWNVQVKSIQNFNESRRGAFSPFMTGMTVATYKGREIMGTWGEYTLDVRDGSVVSIDQHYDYEIVAEDVRIDPIEAANLGKKYYLEALKKYPFLKPNEFDPQIPLRIVFCSLDIVSPERKTVAYLMKFGSDSVFIDAMTGRSLGVFPFVRK